MFWRRRLIHILSCLVVVCIAHNALAAPPNLSLSVIQSMQTLRPEDQTRVEEYVKFWTGQLSNGQSTPAEVAQAAQQLIDPAMSANAGAGFLSTYSMIAMPSLKALVKSGGEEYRSVLALKVMGFLGTPDALDELSLRCDLNTEPRMSARLWAARGCQLIIEKLGGAAGASGMNDRQISQAVRRLNSAAKMETDWLVLLRQFQAMAAAKTKAARDQQLDAFKAVTARIETGDEANAANIMNAISRMMLTFRNQYLGLTNSPQAQKEFGSELAPHLSEVYDIAMAHWESAQGDPEAKRIFGEAVQQSESLLRFIDQTVRVGQQTPNTALYNAWTASNRPRFEADTKSWQSVLQAPPYVK